MKDMFRKAIRRGFDELESWSAQRHLERELDLRLGFRAAEAAVAEVIAEVFEVPVAGADWETHLSADSFSDEDYQQTVEAVCRQSGSSETDVRLEASVSSVPEEDLEEGDKVSHSFGLLHDPPAAVFDPVIHDLEVVATEVMGQIPDSKRGRLRRRFETAEFDLHLPLPRREAVEALLKPFKNLPAYAREVSLTSFLRLDDVSVGASTVAVHASVHQEPDDSVVSAHLQCHLRSADDRLEVERRLDQAVALLKTVV
jgi:hypothetical protein